jgi:hypothetical protein
MKPRRPSRGVVARQIEKVGAVQRQIRRERERHSNRVSSIAVQRGALGAVQEPTLRAAEMARLRCAEVEEHQRHRARLSELERRAREVWR